jgi:hypothetical protein
MLLIPIVNNISNPMTLKIYINTLRLNAQPSDDESSREVTARFCNDDKGSPEVTARFCNDAKVRGRLRQSFVMMTKVRLRLRRGFVTTRKFAGGYGEVL